MPKFNKWKYDKINNSLQYTGPSTGPGCPIGERNIWLHENAGNSNFLLSMVRCVVKVLNDNKIDLEIVLSKDGCLKGFKIKK